MTDVRLKPGGAPLGGAAKTPTPLRAKTPKFTHVDIKRAVRAIESAGKKVAAVDFPPDGGFRVLLGEPSAPTVLTLGRSNEWDDVLPSSS